MVRAPVKRDAPLPGHAAGNMGGYRPQSVRSLGRGPPPAWDDHGRLICLARALDGSSLPPSPPSPAGSILPASAGLLCRLPSTAGGRPPLRRAWAAPALAEGN